MENTKELFSSLIAYISGILGLSYTIQDIKNIASIVCTVLCIMSMLFTFGITVLNKIKKAKEDGVISKEEVKDITDTIKDGMGKIKDQIENKEDK
ncbi:hypothetical protein MSH26_01480 [bacterium]|nr:hypothetical protein [bacterium]